MKACKFSPCPTMDRSMYTDAEFRLATERNLKYQGTARVDLNQIVPHPTIARNIDSKNVRRLCGIFGKDGCRRLSLHNHVTAIVSRQDLHSALRAARVGAHELMTNLEDRHPLLHFSTGQVQCLHGQHRLKAGEEFLPRNDQWWTVDLYLDGEKTPSLWSLLNLFSFTPSPSLSSLLLYYTFLSLLPAMCLPSLSLLVCY